MSDPLLNLTVFAVLGALFVLVAWPGRGLIPRFRRGARSTVRVQLEDTLKHLLDCERSGRAGTLQNVAGRLGVSQGRAAELLGLLAARGLARPGGRGFELTAAGEAYAVRVVRTHRLWERYLADRTGLPAADWHAEAERVEHELTPADADLLAARLGHPAYDPHGDPIPTAHGLLPGTSGIALPAAHAGNRYRITHLEDEPREIFGRLTEMGLAPGLTLDVLSVGPDGIRIRAGGEERLVAAADAPNLTVEPMPDEAGAPGGRQTLADVRPGEEARVVRLSPVCSGPQRRRLLDLGVVPGTTVVPELVSASGDPVAYRIRGALVALRHEQASWIEVEPEPAEAVS